MKAFAQGHFGVRWRFSVILSLLLASSLSLCGAQDTHQEEADRLAEPLNWQPDSIVADIGAGEGQMTLAAATRVAKVYTTELDAKPFAKLEQFAAKDKNFLRVRGRQNPRRLA
jgi:hypothetical protein